MPRPVPLAILPEPSAAPTPTSLPATAAPRQLRNRARSESSRASWTASRSVGANGFGALLSSVSKLGDAQASVGQGENAMNYAVNLANSQLTNIAAAESGIGQQQWQHNERGVVAPGQ